MALEEEVEEVEEATTDIQSEATLEEAESLQLDHLLVSHQMVKRTRRQAMMEVAVPTCPRQNQPKVNNGTEMVPKKMNRNFGSKYSNPPALQ